MDTKPHDNTVSQFPSTNFCPTGEPSISFSSKAISTPLKKKNSWVEYATDLRVDGIRQCDDGAKKRQDVHACGECPYTTKRRTNLTRHRLAMHSRDKQLECCGELFSSKSELRRHVRHRHNRGYSCVQCGRLFCRKALLKRHMSVHNGVREFACRICTYASSHKSNLERHQRVHGKHNFGSMARRRLEGCSELQSQRTVDRGSAFESVPEMEKVMNCLKTLYHKTIEITPETQRDAPTDSNRNIPSATIADPKRMYAYPYKCLLCKQRWESQEAFSKHERALHPDLELRALLSLPMMRVLQLIHLAGVRVTMATCASQ